MNQNPRSIPTRSFAISVSSGARQSSYEGSQNRSAAAERVAGTAASSATTSDARANEWAHDIPSLRGPNRRVSGSCERKPNAGQIRGKMETICPYRPETIHNIGVLPPGTPAELNQSAEARRVGSGCNG